MARPAGQNYGEFPPWHQGMNLYSCLDGQSQVSSESQFCVDYLFFSLDVYQSEWELHPQVWHFLVTIISKFLYYQVANATEPEKRVMIESPWCKVHGVARSCKKWKTQLGWDGFLQPTMWEELISSVSLFHMAISNKIHTSFGENKTKVGLKCPIQGALVNPV